MILNKEIVRTNEKNYLLSTYIIDDMTWDVAYKKGYREANHPLPAIVQSFEFGWSLSESCVVLMCWTRGVYSESI